MKQLFRRLQRRRQHRTPKLPTEPVIPNTAATLLPHGIPSTVVVEPKTDEDATTVSRYTMDSRGHFCLQTDMDEAIVQLAVSAIAMTMNNLSPAGITTTSVEKRDAKYVESATSTTSVKENDATAAEGDTKIDKTNAQKTAIGFHETQATLAVEQSNWNLAIFHYEHALQGLKDSSTWNSETLGTISTILNNLAYAAQVVRYTSSDKIIRFYQAALSIKRHVYGKLHESTAKTLNNLGSTHYLNRQFHPAASYYEEARDILRLLPNARHLANEIATISSNLGDVHYCLHQFERANLEYRSSLRLRWSLYAKSDAKITRLLEQIATTEQKIKHHNERQDDDSSSVSSGRSRGSWNQEIEQLQTELFVDLEFLDALEHSVPIQMAKDKAVVFRELRNFTTKSSIAPCVVSVGGEKSSAGDATASVTAVYERNAMCPEASIDTTQGKPETLSETSVQFTGEWTVLGKDPLMSLKEEAASHITNVRSVKEEESSTLTKDRPGRLALSRFSSDTIAADSTMVVTPPATPTRSARRLRHTPVITSPQRLTQNERQAALLDVKARLAQLRASRKPSNSRSSSMVLV